MANVLIAGCGYVGTALGQRLAAEGHTVWGLRRRPELIPEPIRPLRADLTRSEDLRSLPDAVDLVAYTAAADRGDEEGYRDAYVRGLRNLLAALSDRSAPRPRIVFTSSTAVYGQSGGEWVDEGSPAEPRSYTGRILLEAEEVLLSTWPDGIVVRLGGIYGPGRTGLVDGVRNGTAGLPLRDPTYTNRIHRDDCAGILLHLMRLERPDPVYLGVDSDPAERSLVLRWLADRLGVAAPSAAERSPRRRGPFTNKRCRNTRLLATGYHLSYPTFREGYGALLETR